MAKGLGINNPLLDADSYKASHAVQYPEGTQRVYSYIESRGGDYDRTVFFGLQMFLKKYMSKPITRAQVDEAEEVWTAHGEPFERTMWDYIVDVHGGHLPLEIRALPEGTVIKTKNVLLTVTNTDEKCAAAVSFFETALLRAIWYPTTVATNSYRIKQVLRHYFNMTSDDPKQVEYMAMPQPIDFKLHDFGARGVSSKESAGIGGAAHLVNFRGSDTMTGILYCRQFYDEPMAAFSIPAGEHSTVTSYGRNGEVAYLANMIKQYGKPGAIFACPIDSYDTWDFLDRVLGENIEAIKASGAVYVARPDSGNPLTNPVEVVERLGALYGFTTNSKFFKVLPPYLRVIQGDGITVDTLPQILENLMNAGWSVDNIAFGMGGGLLQHVDRDTFKFAMKCSAAKVLGKWIDVYKNPIDQPNKASKKGRFAVVLRNGKLVTDTNAIEFDIQDSSNLLQVVWQDGVLVRNEDLSTIRARAFV